MDNSSSSFRAAAKVVVSPGPVAMLLAEQIIRLASCGRSARMPLIFSR
jgi:hypothetical protein